VKHHVRGALSLALLILVLSGCRTIDRVRKNETLYFVGGFSSWDFEPMRRDANNPYRFKMGRMMTWKGDGQFKFGTKINNWENQYHPYTANAPFSYTLAIRDSSENNTWLLHEAESNRAYKMSLDTGVWPMKFVMFPFDAYPAVYISGDAAGGGAMNPAYALSPVDNNPYIMSWQGTLRPGTFNFLCEGYSGGEGSGGESPGDPGPVFQPWKDRLTPDGSEQQVDLSDSGGGRGWLIEKEGVYLVVFDQLQEYAQVIRCGD